MKHRWPLSMPFGIAAALFLLFPVMAFSQTAVKVHINGLKQELEKNWLKVPKSSNCTVFWEASGAQSDILNKDTFGRIDGYRVKCLVENIEQQSVTAQKDKNFVTFNGLELGKRYSFVVDAVNSGEVVAASDTARLLTGRVYSADGNGGSGKPWYYLYFPLSGRIPMALIGRGYVFDTSTKAGKIAFHLIWNAFLAGMIIWVFFCWRFLRMNRVFPLRKKLFLFGKSYQGTYKYVSQDFKEIITKWHRLVNLANTHVREGIKNGTHSRIEDIEMDNIKFWRESGSNSIRQLLRRIADPSLHLTDYPAVRIIKAGLETHELGGFRWGEVSREVDRVIENRASSEIEQLKRSSLIDWLWNLGTLAPLIGLFGTATGISHAFAMLTMVHADISQSELVRRLAGGIFEALWTTILGLFVGIMLMLLFYYYQNKLNWLYAKWENIYVNISESM
ncbi:MotA/TolQ/ExbB proton channel family protein [bacterium]|nr:MotA/TolQ/ExbB proton channel family protein [bacterium]